MNRVFEWIERPRVPALVALFRIVFFFGLALHFGPSLLHLGENYAADVVRSKEWSTTLYALLPTLSPALVNGIAMVTLLSCLGAMLGIYTRAMAAMSYAGFYTFASFNGLPTQTLAIVSAWAFLTVFSLWRGADDVWSIAALRRRRLGLSLPTPRVRPLGNLLLFQVVLAVMFAGVEKLLAGWPLQGEMTLLMNTPRGFLLRDWVFEVDMMRSAAFGSFLSWATLAVELLIPFLMFTRFRRMAVAIHSAFFIGIVMVIEVPPLFFFMFFFGGLLALTQEDVDALRLRLLPLRVKTSHDGPTVSRL